MVTHIIYLTKDENKALQLTHQGFTSRAISEQCTIPPSGWPVFAQDIRRKTGIRDLRDTAETRAYFERYAATMALKSVTAYQIRLLKWSLGQTHGPSLGIPYDEAMVLVREACKAAAIFTEDERARKAQSRLYLACFHFNGKKLTHLEMQILRAMADGQRFFQIADSIANAPVKYLKGIAKDACMRLNFDSSGRNTQRNLLRLYFAYIDANTGMNDPAFN